MTNRESIEVNERTNGVVSITFLDEESDAVLLAAVDSIEMTLLEKDGETIVNSRQKQNVLNANNCEFHATSGLFTWEYQPADTAIVGSTPIGRRENHLATITLKWDSTKEMHQEILLSVLNLTSVPQVAP